MLARRVQDNVVGKPGQFPATALLGQRQVGQTTRVQTIAEDQVGLYLDLECPADRQ